MALPNPGMDAVPFTPLTAEFLDDMIENIESLSDGTGFENGAITTNTLADGAVNAQKMSVTASGAFSAYNNNTNQSIAPSVFTRVNMNTEVFDSLGWFNAQTGTFNPQVPGYYILCGFVGLNQTADQGTVHVSIRKNGTNFNWTRIRSSGAGEVGGLVSTVVYANGTTDYFDVAVFSSVSTTVAGSQQNTWFSGGRI